MKEGVEKDIKDNPELMRDLKRTGFSAAEARNAVLARPRKGLSRGFGHGFYAYTYPETKLQLLFIKADFAHLIKNRLAQGDTNRDFIIYEIGIGDHTHESEAILRAFYDTLASLGQDLCGWHVRLIGFDINAKRLYDAIKRFKPVNAEDTNALTSVLGVKKADISVEFYRANVYDAIEMRRLINRLGLRNIKGDYILARYLNYENSSARDGYFEKSLKYYETGSGEALMRTLQPYLTYRNALLLLGRPEEENSPGTRYVIDPGAISYDENTILIPPGTDFVGLEMLGILEYKNQKIVMDTGLMDFKNSVRTAPSIYDNIDLDLNKATLTIRSRDLNPYSLVVNAGWVNEPEPEMTLLKPALRRIPDRVSRAIGAAA